MPTLLPRIVIPFASLVVGAMAVAVHGGCSSSTPPSVSIVRGRVTFQGQPVAGGLVVFAPDPDRGGTGKPARGETGADGTFQLQLGETPNIPPGWYRVAIAVLPDSGKPGFPTQLARPDRSNLVREVTVGKEQFFEFAVEVPGG